MTTTNNSDHATIISQLTTLLAERNTRDQQLDERRQEKARLQKYRDELERMIESTIVSANLAPGGYMLPGGTRLMVITELGDGHESVPDAEIVEMILP